MEVLYHIRPYVEDIPLYKSEKRGLIYAGTSVLNRFLASMAIEYGSQVPKHTTYSCLYRGMGQN